jgi:FMN phosphatase YigB (HAD superfamily)
MLDLFDALVTTDIAGAKRPAPEIFWDQFLLGHSIHY